MFCYNCGCHLSEHDFCTNCGADVSLYKKIMHISNMFYNDGLEKARVRDLSGAMTCLRQSLKFNKNNVEARNLLGLVYFESGEIVAALSEWVISKNLRPEKNIADDYIGRLQSNAVRLDSLNQTIKKYNQALVYCIQDSKDLAVIQLKKVLSLNPKFVRAHLLLALLYMDSEQWEKALRELKKCKVIDCNNTLTLRYLQEVEAMLVPEENGKSNKKQKKDETIRYQSGNEVIIQPVSVAEQKGGGIASTLLNIAVGLIIGLVAMYYLGVPAAESKAKNEAQRTITEIGNQLDAKTATIKELEGKVESLEKQKDALNLQVQEYAGTDGMLSIMDSMFDAASIYIETKDAQQTSEMLDKVTANIDPNTASESFKKLYGLIISDIGPMLAESYYNSGVEASKSEDFATAIDHFQKSFSYDGSKPDPLYEMAIAYTKSEQLEEAVATYEKIIELFPETEWSQRAERNKEEILNPSTEE